MKYMMLVLFMVMITITSCIRDLANTADELSRVKTVKWNPELAVPLIKAELNASDLILQDKSGLIQTDAEDLVHVIYEDELVSLTASEIFEIGDQAHSFSYALTPGDVFDLQSNGSLTIQDSRFLKWTVMDMELDSLIMKVCAHFMELSTNLEHDVSIDITFPDVTKNGQPYSVNISLPYNGTASRTSSQTNSLSQYFCDFSKGPNNINELKMESTITITDRGNTISAGQTVGVQSRFLYNDYRTVWGFGTTQDLFLEEDTINLSIFDNNTKGSFTLEDPHFAIYFANSFGAKIVADLGNITAYRDGSSPIVLTGVPSPLPIPIPTNAQLGQLLKDSVILDNNTSNIKQIINAQPQNMGYSINAQLNPPGTTERNFVMDTSRLSIRLFVDLPLNGTLTNYVLEQEQDIDFSFQNDVEQIDYVLFRLSIDNSFPIGFGVQVYFEDDQGTVLDSLFHDAPFTVDPGITDANGRVITSVKNIEDIRIDQDRIDIIENATKARIYSIFNSPIISGNQDLIKIYGDNTMFVKLGAQSKLEVISK